MTEQVLVGVAFLEDRPNRLAPPRPKLGDPFVDRSDAATVNQSGVLVEKCLDDCSLLVPGEIVDSATDVSRMEQLDPRRMVVGLITVGKTVWAVVNERL
jgi:hypothetical protein